MTWPTRKMDKNERWDKKCAGGCGSFVPPEYDLCDYCLRYKYHTLSEAPDVTGCCSCVESSYSAEMVTRMLRRALGQTEVRSR